MADQNIIEFRLSGGKTNTNTQNSLGGEMSEDPAAVIQSSSILNLFDHVTLPRATSGEFEYLCEYINCKNATEGLPSARYWLDRDTLSDENAFSWSLDNTVNTFINQNTIKFDGVDDDIDCTNDATLWSTSLTKFSLSFWVYVTLWADGNDRTIVDHGGTTNGSFRAFADQTTSGKFRFVVKSSAAVNVTAEVTGGVLNDWNQVTCVYDNSLGSANVKIYLNGVLGGVTGNLTEAINLSATLLLSAATTDFKGNMKQFKFWKTTALTQADAANLYAGNDSLVTTPSYNLPMDEGQGNPLDTISGTKVGTLTNGALWDNTIKTIRPSGNKYVYAPFKRYNGTSDNDSIADDPTLDLVKFSLAAWIRTSKDYSGGIGYIVCKGSPATETAGQNVNYSLRITTANKLEGYFETSAGVDKLVTTTNTFNDGKWHFVVLTYDQVNFRIFVDGMEAGTALAETSAPDTNAKNLFIGAIDGGGGNYFQGDIDEVRVWNNNITAREQADFYTFGTRPQLSNVVFHQKNGDYNGSRIAQVIPNITTAPLLASWNDESAEPQSPNLYQPDILKAGTNNLFDSYFPIWFKRRILANSNSSMDNVGIFKLKGFLRRSNTDQGSGDNGSTPPATVDNVTFGDGGDSDCNSTVDKLMNVAKTNGATYWLVNGDIVYGSDTKCMSDRISSNFTAGVVVNGNHDGGSKISFWRSIMGTQQNYFRKDIQNICILGMDSEQSFSTSSNQYDFINTELQKASADTNIDWIIVMIHRPFISQSSTHPENEGNKADIYFPLFTQYHVDLVLQAHNHNIQRSKLLVDNPSNHTSPTVVTSGSTFTKGQGFVVVHNGTLGHDTGNNLYPLNGSPPNWQQYGSDKINAVTLLQWTGTNNSTLTCMIHDINNEMQDTFTIS